MQSVTELQPVVKTMQELATEYNLGWLVYANEMPASVCGTLTMVAGWLQANKDEANAMMCEVRPRIVAIGRCKNGGSFKVVAPADWPTNAEVDAICQKPGRLTAEQVEEMERERIGAELSESPSLW
jgi:hypothetical protein